MQYLETHGLAPAADAFSREPIEALEAISKQLGPSPDAAGMREFLLSHKNVEEARIPEEHALNMYVEFSSAAMERHNWNVGSSAYKEEVYPKLKQHGVLSGRRQALEEQHQHLMGRLGISKARGAEILAGSPVSAAREALISVTLARYAFLKKHALPVFTDKVDNAIVEQDHKWLQEKRASLATVGHRGKKLDQLVNDARAYRQSGLQNLQITDAIHDGMNALSEVITKELENTEQAIAAELRQHSERLENALKDVARHIGGSIEQAAEYVAETQRQTGQNLNATLEASIAVARDAATKQHKMLTSIYDAVHKDNKRRGVAEKTMLDVGKYSMKHLASSGIKHAAKIILNGLGVS